MTSSGSQPRPYSAKQLRSHAREVVQAELRQYDSLSRDSRYAYEHATAHYIPSLIERGIYKCAHEVMLFEPCVKCERSIEDCQTYAISAQARIRQLLSILNSTEVK